jgi:cytochrome c oxidase subunit 1
VAARTETAVPAWQRGRVASWLVTTDHKRIGILYILTSVVFLVLAGAMALLMRLQLAQANADVISADRYNELVTIHGTSMVFLVGIPILAGFGNYLVPLMIGARDVAFPRVNALSYWLFLFGGLVLMLSFFAAGGAADTGWTAYPPLSIQAPGSGQDLWILSLHILTASTVAGAINFIVTIHNMRTAGMTWTRTPLFVWSILLFAWLIMAVYPVLSAGLSSRRG